MSAKRLLSKPQLDWAARQRRQKRLERVAHARNKISADAMRAYLDDPQLTDHDFIKKCSYADLMDSLPWRFMFYTKPKLHQLACFVLAIDYSGFAFFVDMGGGKTRIMLDMVRYRKRYSGLGKTLVVVPYPVNLLTWQDEAKLHAPDLELVSLMGTKEERDKALEKDGDVYVINYLGLFVMMCDLVRELTDKEIAENKARDAKGVAKRYRHKTGRRMNKARAEAFAELWDCVIYDESQFIGGHDSTQFDLCAMLSRSTRFSYVLSGTPFGKDPAPVWSQFYCADLGLTFGSKFTLFRSVFYDAKVDYAAIIYKFNKGHEKDLRRMMRNRSIRFEDTEFSDLPPVTRQVIRVKLTPEMWPYYQRRKLELVDVMRKRQLRLIENKYHQMRTITSGYLLTEFAEDDETFRVRSRLTENPKLEALHSLITSLPLERKLTIYHEYVYTGDIIEEDIKSLKIPYARLGGGRDGGKELSKFLHNDDCRLLIAQSKAGGVGSNLQTVCNYCCYFESPSDPVVRKQSEKRFPREGQTRRVFIYDLLMDDTIDSEIQEGLTSGLDFLKRLLGSAA